MRNPSLPLQSNSSASFKNVSALQVLVHVDSAVACAATPLWPFPVVSQTGMKRENDLKRSQQLEFYRTEREREKKRHILAQV